jgi:hypothetical protein
MGGRGSGGLRTGAGRKSKQVAQKILEGAASLAERRQHAASVPKVDEFDAPNDLTTEERNVWLRLAPHAFKARTLTAATEYQFVMLCRNILLERLIAVDVEQIGGANHRGIIQRIDAELARFCLAPMGKPLIDDAPKVVDPFEEFDGGATH